MKNKASLKSTVKSDSSLPSQGVCNLSGIAMNKAIIMITDNDN